MSDALILGISGAAFLALTALLTIWLNGIVARKAAEQAHQFKKELSDQIAVESKVTNDKIEEVNVKTESHHKEIDGKLTRLMELEKRISFIEGAQQGKSDQIILNQQNQPIVNDPPTENQPSTVEGKGIKKDLTQAKEKKIDQAKKKLDEI